MTDTTTATTRAVTVGEAYDGRLWETGTLVFAYLKRRTLIASIRPWTTDDAYFCLYDDVGAFVADAEVGERLDYTPHVPADTFAPRDLDAQREIVRLSNALATVTRERDEARYEVARLHKLFKVST